MTNEDYQLEELENAAVNKSNNAKRAAAAAALLATAGAAGAAGYAAKDITINPDEPVEDTLTEEDLESVADAGANQVQDSQPQPQPAPQPAPQPTAPQPAQPAQDDVDVSFDKTTHYYDEDNNLVATTEEGTINGKQFMLLDADGDNKADVLAYDENGNGRYEEREIVELDAENKFAMGNEATTHEDVFLASHDPEPEPEPYPYPDDYNGEKDYADNNIYNDFEDEKTGESYSHDYAENNENYNNNGDVEPYSAGENDYAYEKDENDYEYDGLAENDTTEETYDDLGSDSLDLV